MSRTIVARALLCLTLSAPLAAAEPRPPQILVFAAASLADALQEAGAAYAKTLPLTVTSSFDSSSALARQIEAGAPADVFFAADTQWMDYLQSRNLIQPASRKNLLGNSLVLIAPAQSPIHLQIRPHFPLAAALGNGRLATGDPDSVPAGRYARSALTSLGLWNEIAPRLARAENVRVALLYVARGETPLGIVYASDALAEKGVRVVDTFPADTHEPILYPIALTTSARAQAKTFVAYLMGPQAHDIFVKHGFTVLEHRAP
ncbi:MAG TPA: molybdate ABC transporter substrate-binding protein [Steroidobacteraceae bacterium]|nr:molybdate ABC transporter substrate-binding protein [Steroidobacteraceae bacterium]